MRLLVVNVNTTESMTESIGRRARQVAAPGTEIVTLTPTFGAESCESNLDSHLAAIGVADRVLAYQDTFDAVVQAGFGEHGRELLRELLDTPVVDITDAAAHLACQLGRRYSVITTEDRSISLIEDRLLLAGLDRTCASVLAAGIGVLDVATDEDQTIRAIAEVARTAMSRDRAEVICLGCAGMANLAGKIQAAVGIPVVDGVGAAVKLAEALVTLGLSTSKSLTYAPPHPKGYLGWPLSSAPR